VHQVATYAAVVTGKTEGERGVVFDVHYTLDVVDAVDVGKGKLLAIAPAMVLRDIARACELEADTNDTTTTKQETP
jgi:arginine utilization protein RocB